MSSTNKTSHFDLPQFAGADKPTMADLNAAFQAVDAALFSLLPRVNKLMFTTENVNPGTYIPNTTWVAWGSGRMPVGVDAQQTEFNAVEKTSGSNSVTIDYKNLPGAVCALGVNTTGAVCAGNASGGIAIGATGFGRIDSLDSRQSGQAISTLPECITCYMWKRTA